MKANRCPKRYSFPIILALFGIFLAGAAMLVHPCGFGATALGDFLHTPIICGIIGLMLMGCGTVLSFSIYRRASEVDWLRKNGERLNARIVEVNEIHSRAKPEKISYQVVCEACDPLNGRLRRFNSEPLSSKPNCCCGSSKVEVLTDPGNPKIYHVEVN